jgi:hypothetical protein
MAYAHTNSKGVTYYLFKKDVVLRGGKEQTIYYFSKDKNNSKGEAVEAVPEDREVVENARNGFLALRKKS